MDNLTLSCVIVSLVLIALYFLAPQLVLLLKLTAFTLTGALLWKNRELLAWVVNRNWAFKSSEKENQ